MTTDPSALPGDIYAGPYGFLVAIAFFIWLAAREFRRGRQIDVQNYQGDISALRKQLEDRDAEHRKETERHRQQQEERDKEHREEVAGLKNDIEDLKAEVGALRDQNFSESRAANQQREQLIRENAVLRTVLAENNISTEGVTG